MGKTRVTWINDMNFMGTDENGKGTLISGPDGPGVRPMQMLLLGLGGCASFDVITILQKQRQALHDLSIEMEGERGEEYPRPFKKIHMHFILEGDNLDPKKVDRAITLSTEKYCGAHATLAGVADITWDREIRQK